MFSLPQFEGWLIKYTYGSPLISINYAAMFKSVNVWYSRFWVHSPCAMDSSQTYVTPIVVHNLAYHLHGSGSEQQNGTNERPHNSVLVKKI